MMPIVFGHYQIQSYKTILFKGLKYDRLWFIQEWMEATILKLNLGKLKHHDYPGEVL